MNLDRVITLAIAVCVLNNSWDGLVQRYQYLKAKRDLKAAQRAWNEQRNERLAEARFQEEARIVLKDIR